jgi:hypothetical protein
MQAPLTYSEFVEAFPAFLTSPSGQVSMQLSLSSRLLDPLVWGDFYRDAMGYDAAHNLTLALLMSQDAQSAQQAAAGPVSSVSAAGVSISFEGSSTQGGTKQTHGTARRGMGRCSSGCVMQ